LQKYVSAIYTSDMTIFLFTLAAAIAALAGGYTAIRTKKHLSLAMALTSGLVLGLVGFDLLPEIFEGAERSGLDNVWPMILFVAGFLVFHIVEKVVLVHGAEESQYKGHSHPKLGMARAVALACHSFFDGLSIGVAFQISPTVGLVVALAVIGHRFADGFDTANFMLLHKNNMKRILQLMALVVIAPIAGGIVSLFIHFSEGALSVYLGFFAGVLMYIAASNILPQAHSKVSPYKSIGLTIAGAAFILLVTRFGV
jgi:zinc transporter ZupT